MKKLVIGMVIAAIVFATVTYAVTKRYMAGRGSVGVEVLRVTEEVIRYKHFLYVTVRNSSRFDTTITYIRTGSMTYLPPHYDETMCNVRINREETQKVLLYDLRYAPVSTYDVVEITLHLVHDNGKTYIIQWEGEVEFIDMG